MLLNKLFCRPQVDGFGVGNGREPIADLMRELMILTADVAFETRIKAVERAIADGLSQGGERMFLYNLPNIPQSVEMHAV